MYFQYQLKDHWKFRDYILDSENCVIIERSQNCWQMLLTKNKITFVMFTKKYDYFYVTLFNRFILYRRHKKACTNLKEFPKIQCQIWMPIYWKEKSGRFWAKTYFPQKVIYRFYTPIKLADKKKLTLTTFYFFWDSNLTLLIVLWKSNFIFNTNDMLCLSWNSSLKFSQKSGIHKLKSTMKENELNYSW